MKYLIVWGTLCIKLFITAAQISSPQKGYIFTSPRTLNTESNNELHMQLFGKFDAINLDVQAFYKRSYDSPNETLAAKETFQIPAGQADVILNFFVGKLDRNVYDGRIQINGTSPNFKISGSDKVRYFTPKTDIIIIQTDKPLYQPGQIVKFRIIRVNKDLKPYESTYKTDVHVQDPKGTRLFQFNDLDLSKGVVQKEFLLTDEPVEGSWSITASSNDNTDKAYFDVKKYVLPKFDVNIKFPSYVLANSESFPVEICAKYTYGKPVFGSLHINASLEKYTYSRDKFPTLQKTVQIDGCYNYTVNIPLIEPDNKFTYRRIQISVHVIESGTGVERDATNYIRRDTSPLKLEFKDQRGNFKVGLPFNGKLVVSYPDDTPAVGESIEICEEVTENRIIADWSATKTYQMCNNYTSDDDGIILFYVLAKNIDVTSIQLTAKSIKYASSDSKEGRQNALYQPETSTYLTSFYSPSRSFIQIQSVEQPVNCNIKQNFSILFTAKENENFKFYYQITKQSEIVLVSTVEKAFSVDDDISGKFQNDPKLISSTPVYINPSPKSISTSTDADNCQAAQDKQQLPLVGRVYVSIDIDTNLSPGFHLLIYYVKDDRETVADSQEINVEKCFKNKVDFQFGDAVQQPSMPTTIKLKASPNSLCGIKAIDKSITLLDNSDELTAENIFQKLENLDDNQYYPTDPCYDSPVQPGLENSADSYVIIPPPGGFGSRSYDDSLTSFHTSGFVVISNFLLFTRPCPTTGSNFGRVAYAYGARAEAYMAEETDSLVSVKNVRNYFPETWLFEMEMTGPDGTFETKEQLPDSITEWIGSAFCINSKDGLGISNKTSIRAFQAFFIDYTIPVSVIRDEEFVVVVSVFSYTKDALPITVSIINPEGFEVTNNSIDGDYCLRPDSSLSLPLTLKATKIGKVNITVKAETAKSSSPCGENSSYFNVFARDAVTKPIEVEAEGFPAENVVNTLFCPSDHEHNIFEDKITLSVPNDIVPNSSRAFVDVTGNVLGPAINNLDDLVSLPTGCGEQNMVKFTPNYVVLDYLKSTGMLTKDIKDKAISNLIEGYQRELKFRHDDGSFSAFGEADIQGSMFLTAFVLKSFYQAKRYIYIDDDLIQDMQRWILSRQNADGCFQDIGPIIDIGLEGGVDKDMSSGSITAYVLASLILSNFTNQTILNGGFLCLKKNPPSNPYSQMLYAYAESLSGRHDNAQTYITEARQRINRTGGMESFLIVNGTKAIEIETDAYAILATLTNGGGASDALPYVRYLTNNLNPNGGFQSTQDTCVGLEALAQFAKIVSKNPLDMIVSLSGAVSQQVAVNDGNKLVVQRFKVSDIPSDVSVKAKGSGCGLIQSSIRYNTKTPPEKNKFALTVNGECSFSSCQYVTITVTVSYLPSNQKSGMSIVEIKLITGYVPNKGSLDELQSDDSNKILRVDVQNNKVILYFSELSNVPQNFSFRIEQVVEVKNPQPGTAIVYDYYANENSDSTSYTIQRLNSEEWYWK